MKMMKFSLVTLVLSQSSDTNKELQEKLDELASQEGNGADFGDFDFGAADSSEIGAVGGSVGGDEAETVSVNEAETGGDPQPENEVETVETSPSSTASSDEPSETVSCGAHETATCADCVSGACDNKADDNQCHESAWCNGDCVWESDACKASTTKGKSCGQHQAASCESCPPSGVDDKSRFCNGDCTWDEEDNSCKDKN